MDSLNLLIAKYNLSDDARIGSGMEAVAYAYGTDKVLKIYAGTATYADLVTLKDFYQSLNRHLVPYQLPHVESVVQEPGHVVTVEQRLNGRSLSTVLPHLNDQELDAAMEAYLTAVLALANIDAPSNLDRFKLFDPQQISQPTSGDWHQFLLKFIQHNLTSVALYLQRDVADFSEKLESLKAILTLPYNGAYKLIHGDICPGNLLIGNHNQPLALLDFGLLTMYGDHLFDVATSWVFFDMYDELKAKIYERYLAMLLEAVGPDKRGLLYRYILIYSILSANTYSPDCSDGHYHWCVANLSNPHYWKHIS